jgi:hypothetical protein
MPRKNRAQARFFFVSTDSGNMTILYAQGQQGPKGPQENKAQEGSGASPNNLGIPLLPQQKR